MPFQPLKFRAIEACFKVYRLTQIDNIHVKAWWSTDSPRRLQQSANWETSELYMEDLDHTRADSSELNAATAHCAD